MKAYPALVNQWAITALKKLSPAFVCGYSNSELARKLTLDDIVLASNCAEVGSLSFDASKHDSH